MLDQSAQEAENCKIVQAIYDAANNGDVATIQGLLAPDVALLQAPTLPHGGEFRGLEAALGGIGKMFETFDLSSIEVRQLAADGDLVIGLINLVGTFRATGQPCNEAVAECFRIRDGKVYEIQPFYYDTGAIAAAVSA